MGEANRLLRGGKFDAATARFSELVAKDPDLVAALRGLAKSLARQGRYPEVVEVLAEAAPRLGSRSLLRLLGDAHRVLAMRGEASHVGPALQAYEHSHRIRPEPVSLFYRGELLRLFNGGNPEAAARCYLEAWEIDGRDYRSYRAALDCLRRVGRHDEISDLEDRWNVRNA